MDYAFLEFMGQGFFALLRGVGGDVRFRLLEQGVDLAAQVLKVPHHGGRTSSSEPFLARVQPKIAVVSAGYRNRFRHPHPETLDRYRATAGDLYRTDRDGAVTVTSDGNTVEVTTFRQSSRQ